MSGLSPLREAKRTPPAAKDSTHLRTCADLTRWEIYSENPKMICGFVKPPLQKYLVCNFCKSEIYRFLSRLTEGRLAIVVDAGRDAMDVSGFPDERSRLRTAKPCGPGTPTLVSSLWEAVSAGDGG
jgi:hypothetical protein